MKISSEKEYLKPKLSDFLTLDLGSVSELLNNADEHEVLNLYSVFTLASEGNRQWADSINLKLKVGDWFEDKHGNMRVVFTLKSRIQTTLQQEKNDDFGVTDVSKITSFLYSNLMSHMKEPDKSDYRELCSKISDKIGSEHVEPVFFREVQLYYLSFSEDLYMYLCNIWYEQNPDFFGQSVPNEIGVYFCKWALDEAKNLIDSSIHEYINKSGESNSLVLIVSDNLITNQMLNDYAAIDSRALEANDIATELLINLNEKNIFEVPEIFLDLDQCDKKSLLKAKLEQWFSKEGLLLDGNYFNRPMRKSDIELIVNWSEIVQQMYQSSKGALDPELHNRPANYFIFALGLIGAFYSKNKTTRENTGSSNSTYSIFPGNPSTSHEPRPHVKAILLEIYGQIFWSNSDWLLLHENLDQHLQAAMAKRSYCQQTLYYTVKGRNSRELMAIRDSFVNEFSKRYISNREKRQCNFIEGYV